ncbi:cupin domain-containing protein [Bradyrhizobium sp. AZCC 2289]|uniref:cupin domain-containing protein n=1 Tax=Bradyrhizobium sp. AZCC 2289 TaxID=3117026 RepID=UPI002FF3BA63
MNKPVPVNPPELRSTFVAASSMPWQRTEFDGIEMKILYRDDEGRSTILFKMAPGAVVPLHEHTALEQTFMLEGSLEDRKGSVARVTSCGGRAATSMSRMRPTARRSSPYSIARTAFSMEPNFSLPPRNVVSPTK